MHIAVTGATGFVGAHTTRALLDAGHRVRLLVHPTDRLDDGLAGVGIDARDHEGVRLADDPPGGDPPGSGARGEVVRGDVGDGAAVAALLDGCDAVVHAAGIVGVDDRREAAMWQVNVGATALVLARAVALGLDPIVHVASYAALFPPPTGVIGPDTPPADGRSAYGRTKAAADRIARAFQASGAPVVITYPGSVVGPPAGSQRGVTAEGWAPLLRFGVAPTFEGGMAMIDVRDVADLHAAAMRPGQGPRRLVCGGPMVPFDAALDAIEAARGRPVRRVRLGGRVLRGLGRASDALGRLVPVSPGLSYEAAWILTAAVPTDDSAALDLLGRPWRPVGPAIHAAIAAAPV